MSKELNITIGKRLRTYRESLGMNREAFSEQIGLSPQFLAEAENGKKGLSAESIYKICSNSDLSADYLVLGMLKKDKLKNPLDHILQDMPLTGLNSTRHKKGIASQIVTLRKC